MADEPQAADDPDELRSRYRAALERKQRQASRTDAGSGGARQKIHDTHGRAGGKRNFRRKSG